MDFLHDLVEQRIQEAIKNGDFDNLPGKGKPLVLEDWSSVPEDLRLSYKIMKNSGYLPEEMQLRKDMLTLEDLIRCCRDDTERGQLRSRLNEKTLRFNMLMEERSMNLSPALAQYRDKIHDKFLNPPDKEN
ncbi:DnaJ family domain-containing protein [Paenibacillus sp. FJAT-26967]|uniref:DnaJ family domain-containing protein n=1 Tax=Paenibacillus sp. FJAT-26967 TaxID=1729690 RepID=UPI0008394DE1|nr:DnaJ family domain-containing protein [Paenibacillus sp. FJAT-26967]